MYRITIPAIRRLLDINSEHELQLETSKKPVKEKYVYDETGTYNKSTPSDPVGSTPDQKLYGKEPRTNFFMFGIVIFLIIVLSFLAK